MSNPTTLYWHDYETFGTNPRLDRPVQFAGLRTDTDLNIIGEPLVEYCQPVEDILPQPGACLVTGITPQIAAEKGLPEPEFIARIHAELSVPGTCGVGYNSLRFDDEITRNTLWRNFYDPYRREWADGCSRWDIIDMVRLTYALRPGGMTWPTRDDGAPSFKLEHLAAANNLEQQQAHDALSDVHATIALARLIRAQQPKLYDFVFNNRDKYSARKKLDLHGHKPVLHVSSKFPSEQGCISLVMPIAEHPVNRNAIIAYDLRHDPSDLLTLDAEDIHDRLFTPTADLPEGVERVALKGIHVNKCPVLAPADMLNTEEAKRLQLDGDTLRRHRQALLADIDTVAAKVQQVFSTAAYAADSDPEQALYGGFTGDGDRRLCVQVQGADADALAANPPVFEDERLNAMLFRYRARNFPASLTADEQADWQQWRANRLTYAPDGGLTLAEYDAQLNALPEEIDGDADKMRVLLALKDWGAKLRQGIEKPA